MADSLFSFNANDGPQSYDAMTLRQRIALGMLAQKRTYPKTVGEGIASIGDSIGDVATMRALMGQQTQLEAARAAQQKAADDAAAGGKPAPAATGPRADAGDVPVQTADASVVPDDSAAVPAVPPPAAVASIPVPPDAPIATNPNGTIKGNITAPARSVATAAPAPFFPPPAQAATAAPLPPDPQAALRAGLEQAAAQKLAALQAGTPQQGGRLASTFDQFQPGPGGSQPLYAAADAASEARRADVTGMGGGNSAVYSYAPTASLGRAGPTMSDAPPVTGVSLKAGPAVGDTVQQRRDDITRTLQQQQPVPEVPQPNPTVPPPISAAVGSPPEAQNNRPIVAPDVKPIPAAPAPVPGAQLAQNAVPVTRAAPAPLPNLTPQPVAPIDPAIANKPIEPPTPRPVPPSAAQQSYQKSLDTERDPAMQQFYQGRIAPLEAARARQDVINMQEYQARHTQYDQDFAAWQQRNSPLGQAQASEAQSKAASAADAEVISARTGLPPADALTKFDTLKKTAERDAYAMQQLRIAKQALNAGIVSGVGGTFRLNMERAKAFFGNAPAAELAARSEQFLTAVKSTVANALNNFQPGDTRVTNSDVNVASGMIGADLSLQRATQEKLINAQFDDVHKRINQYEDLKDHYLGGTKMEKMYDVQFDPIHPDQKVTDAYTNALIKNQNDRAAREEFDQKFGPGAAELEIGRAHRAERRKLLGVP